MRIDPLGQGYGTQRRGFGFGGIRWIIMIGFAIYAAVSWFGSAQKDPYTGETAHYGASTDEEVELGTQAFQQVVSDAQSQQALLPPDSPFSQQISDVSRRLIARIPDVTRDLAQQNGVQAPENYRNFDWQAVAIQSDEANAFCLPGGKIAVYTGLQPITQNQSAMAVVLGHEISHALLRHGSQRMAQQKLVQMGQMAAGVALGGMDPNQQRAVMGALGAGAQYGFILPYSRNHEAQADQVGLMLAAAACFDPHEAVPLWQRMEQVGGGERPPEFASTHPDPENRIAHLQQLMPQAEAFYNKYCSTAGAH